jgi:UPF0271 protein
MTHADANTQIDLNADLGEAIDPGAQAVEAALMRIVTSVNIACGGHAGDEGTMLAAAQAALEAGCALGAHPSYPDRAGFGRRRVAMPSEVLAASLAEQISGLARVCAGLGASLAHVKPHGALYHAASEDESVARAIYEAVVIASPGAPLVGAAGSRALAWWEGWGAKTVAEGFADRRYEADGRLRARTLEGALLTNPQEAAAQAVRLVMRGEVVAADGTCVPMAVQTLCLHSDTPGSQEIARCVRLRLEKSGVSVLAYRGGEA